MTAKDEAAALGMARTTYLHRKKHGLPLDAPVLSPSERVAKANEVRLKNQAMARLAKEREKRMARQAREQARKEAKEARKRARQVEAEKRAQRRLDAIKRKAERKEAVRLAEEREFDTIKAAPRQAWQNPFAALAGAKARTKTATKASISRQTARTT